MDNSAITVALAMPRRGSTCSHGAARAYFHARCRSCPQCGGGSELCGDHRLKCDKCSYEFTAPQTMELELGASTILDHTFNLYWAQALDCRDKMGATHFAMIHDDICPEAKWLNCLLDELLRLGADIVSAVVPIKDERGLTSTAVYTGDLWFPKRLLLNDVYKLPPTFGSEDVGGPLLVNTGLWLCDLRKPWCDDWTFDSQKRIHQNPDGKRVVQVVPEDWLFSKYLHDNGAAVYATRKVRLLHDGGSHKYPNFPLMADVWERDETWHQVHDIVKHEPEPAAV